MIERVVGFRLGKELLLGLALLVLGAAALTVYGQERGFSYKEVIVALGVVIVSVIVFGGERGIRLGLIFWILTLALGYRTIEVTPNLRIHPAEILLWLLLACIFAHRQLLSESRLSLPWWLWLFIPFWAAAWWPLIAGNAPWDKMFNEFRDFLLLVPILIVTAVVLKRDRFWQYLVLAFFLASTWIAFMGVVEYWFPDLTSYFPAFIRAAKPEQTAEGFVRAQFSFWGGSQATFVCILALPGALVLTTWWRQWFFRGAIIVAAMLQILAIYIGGYRSIWLVLLIQVLIACMMRLKKHGVVVAALCLVVGLGGYQFIPKTDERVISGIAALKGNPIDHSAQDRKDRALEAISDAITVPFGGGWASAGWVHSDFLQVAANLGLAAGFIFLGGYLYTLVRMGRRMRTWLRTSPQGDLGLSLLLSFVGVGGLLAMQGVQVLPQLALPAWFVWALVDTWLRQTSEVREFSYASANLYPAANF